MKYFVLEFDRTTDRLLLTDFDTIEAALADLSIKEAHKAPQMEVVLLGARSIEDLKATHGRYFMSPTEMVQRMREHLIEDGLLSA